MKRKDSRGCVSFLGGFPIYGMGMCLKCVCIMILEDRVCVKRFSG